MILDLGAMGREYPCRAQGYSREQGWVEVAGSLDVGRARRAPRFAPEAA